LNPSLPPEGMPRRAYLERKFGGPARAAQVYERVRSAGTQCGIAFDFERIVQQPNTRDAHRLVAWAQSQDDAGALVEALFRAFFVEGRFVGSRELLADLAGAAGFDRDAAADFLSSGHGAQEIAAAEARASGLGISGVPFFIVDGRVGLSGAQPAEAIVAAVQRARVREAEAAD
jgi:predicted DsbA family dithiol-disulfide isomerase